MPMVSESIFGYLQNGSGGSHLFLGSCSNQHTMCGLPRGSCSWLIPPSFHPPIFPFCISPHSCIAHETLSACKAWPHPILHQLRNLPVVPTNTLHIIVTHLSPQQGVCTSGQGLIEGEQQRCSSNSSICSLSGEGTHNTEQNGFLKGPLSLYWFDRKWNPWHCASQ